MEGFTQFPKYEYKLFQLSNDQWNDISLTNFGVADWTHQYQPLKILSVDGDDLYIAGQFVTPQGTFMSVYKRVSGEWQGIYEKFFSQDNDKKYNLSFSFDSGFDRQVFAYSYYDSSGVDFVTASSKTSDSTTWQDDINEQFTEDFSGSVHGVHSAKGAYYIALHSNGNPEFIAALKVENSKVFMSKHFAESPIGANTLASEVYGDAFLVLHYSKNKNTQALGQF